MERHKIIASKIYIAVWAMLILLTAVTVMVAQMKLGRLSMLAALAIASVKATLVLSYFMHLRYESRLLKLMFFLPVATLAIIIGLTFFDIWYR